MDLQVIQPAVPEVLMLEPGAGHRFDDCENHSGCMKRFLKRFPSAGNARCPIGCGFYDPPPDHVRLATAQAYGARPNPNRT